MTIGESSVQTPRPQDLGFGPLFWSVRDAVVVGNATTGRIVLWNPAAESLFGYSAAEAVGMVLEDLVPEELRARHRAGLAHYAVNGHGPLIDAGKPIAMPALRKDGTEIAIELSLTPLRPPMGSDATGRYVLANIRDATERQRVAEANTWLAAILEATPDAIVVADSAGAIVTVNAQSERLLGYSRDELIGRSVDMLVSRRLRAGHADHRHDFSADPRTRPMGAGLDLTAQHKDGREIPVEISLSPLLTQDGLFVVSAIRDVTQRRLANQDRARLAAIVDSCDDAVMCVGEDGLITAWNPGAEHVYGYAAGEAIGQPVLKLIPPDLTAERNAIFERLMRGEHVGHFETERLTRDGRRVQVSIATFAIRDADGAVTGVASIARDITERRQGERDRALLAAIVESTDDSIIAIDRDDRITAWNPGAEKLYGYSADETIGRPGSMLVLPELAAQRQELVAQILRGEHVDPYETERLTKDGRRVRIWISSSPVRDVDGAIIGAASIARDVTEQREHEAQLREMDVQLREMQTWHSMLVDQMPAATYIEEVDLGEPQWKSLFVSPQIEKMLGYPVENWMSNPAFGPTLLHPEDRERVMAEDARTEVTGEPYRQKYRMFARDGRIVWIQDEAVLANDDAGQPKYWLGLMRDITEQKQLEAAERETARQLEELDAMRADFARMVAHELGNPIAAVRRSAELLATEPLTASQEWALAVIEKETDALRALTDDVVAIATIERDDFTVHLQPIRVDALLTNAAAFGRTLSGDSPVTIAESTGDEVLADPERISQLLRNLLNNSVKYSPPGTPITLRATRRGQRVRIEVSDLGPGISPEDLHLIFEKFGRGRDQVARNVPGGGLGLYLSRQIVQAHGSDLTVVATSEQGSTFGFDLEVAP